MMGCVSLFAAFIILPFLVWKLWSDPGRRLPAVLGDAEILVGHEENGFREGCTFIAYRLGPGVAARLRAEGRAFLGDDTHPPSESQGNPYSRWISTPARAGDPHAGGLAASGCRNQEELFGGAPEMRLIDAPSHALREPGNHYIVTRNGEGSVIVDARHGLAWFLYFG
jgi:hypothetical protein